MKDASSGSRGDAVVLDASGDVFIAGTRSRLADGRNGSFCFLSRRNAQGGDKWTRTFSCGRANVVLRLVKDGSVIIAGSLTGSTQVFAQRYNGTTAYLMWNYNTVDLVAKNKRHVSGLVLSVNKQHLYLTGTETVSGTVTRAFVDKIAMASGKRVFHKIVGPTTGMTSSFDIAVSTNGDLIVVGSTTDTMHSLRSDSPVQRNSQRQMQAFVLALRESGSPASLSVAWAQQGVDKWAGTSEATSVFVHPAGEINRAFRARAWSINLPLDIHSSLSAKLHSV